MMQHNPNNFLKLVKHPLKFPVFMLMKLPSAFFSGVRVVDVNETACSVEVPYRWFSQNPFRSTYFACLAMAAEMSTGILAMAQVYNRKPSISMLVTSLQATYLKKATGKTIFTCTQGLELKEIIEKAIATGEAQTIQLNSIGKNSEGEELAHFTITWSFKSKKL